MIVVLKIKMRKNKRTLINLSLLSAFGLFLTYTFIKNYVFESSIARFRIVQTTQPINNSKKVILFWNKFFESRYWMMPNETNGEEYLKSIQCPVTNCIFTHDKNFLDQSHLYWQSYSIVLKFGGILIYQQPEVLISFMSLQF